MRNEASEEEYFHYVLRKERGCVKLPEFVPDTAQVSHNPSTPGTAPLEGLHPNKGSLDLELGNVGFLPEYGEAGCLSYLIQIFLFLAM